MAAAAVVEGCFRCLSADGWRHNNSGELETLSTVTMEFFLALFLLSSLLLLPACGRRANPIYPLFIIIREESLPFIAG